MYLLGNLVSFVTVKFFENLSTTDNVTICNAMSYFFGPPCIFSLIYFIFVTFHILQGKVATF